MLFLDLLHNATFLFGCLREAERSEMPPIPQFTGGMDSFSLPQECYRVEFRVVTQVPDLLDVLENELARCPLYSEVANSLSTDQQLSDREMVSAFSRRFTVRKFSPGYDVRVRECPRPGADLRFSPDPEGDGYLVSGTLSRADRVVTHRPMSYGFADDKALLRWFRREFELLLEAQALVGQIGQ